MPRHPDPDRLTIAHFGPIQSAQMDFGDLTVLVGPQASGKSIALQLFKLVLDSRQIETELRRYGLDWTSKLEPFLDIYFGEGMRALWLPGQTELRWKGKDVDLPKVVKPWKNNRPESLFFIPAQRVLTLRDGWPRPFTDFLPGDPFVVREFSERLRMLMESELGSEGSLFPQPRRLKGPIRELLMEQIFPGFELRIDRSRVQKRLVLKAASDQGLPFMVWSAGQREFVPLLLGLYWLMPRAAQGKLQDIQWVVLEELEMGLHPRAINAVVLLVFELLRRGYRVCLSTHSPQVLETLWALKQLQEHGGRADEVHSIFGYARDPNLQGLEANALQANVKVYYFDRSGTVKDISDLSTDSALEWGGLTEFSARANDTVANVVARSEPA